jgi:hypothetical protein
MFLKVPLLMSLRDTLVEIDDSIFTVTTTATTTTTTSIAGNSQRGRPKVTAKGTQKTI